MPNPLTAAVDFFTHATNLPRRNELPEAAIRVVSGTFVATGQSGVANVAGRRVFQAGKTEFEGGDNVCGFVN